MLTWFLAGLLLGCVFGAGMTLLCLGLSFAAKKADIDSERILRERRYRVRTEAQTGRKLSENVPG